METRLCLVCGEELPLEAFAVLGNGTRRWTCAACSEHAAMVNPGSIRTLVWGCAG